MRAASLCFSVALLSLALLLAPPRVAAQNTRSISSMGHMAVLADGSGVFAVENSGTLAFHSAITAGPWREFPAPVFPRSVCASCAACGTCAAPPLQLYPMTGAVAAHTSRFGEHALAVAAFSGLVFPSLWDFNVGGECWTYLDAEKWLTGNPAVAAVESGGRVFVAVRSAFDSHVRIGSYIPQSSCRTSLVVGARIAWTDVTLSGDPSVDGAASDLSMIDVPAGTVAVAGPLGRTIQLHVPAHAQVFGVTSGGVLNTCAVQRDESCPWRTIGTPGPDWRVSTGGVSAALIETRDLAGNVTATEYRVAVGARPRVDALFDSLFLARSNDLVNWRWTALDPVDSVSPELIRYGFATPSHNSLDSSVRQVTTFLGLSSVYHTVYVNDFLGNVLVPCIVPVGLPPASTIPITDPFHHATCQLAGGTGSLPTMPHPPDLQPIQLGFPILRQDAIGPAVAGVVVPDPSSTVSDVRGRPNVYRAFTPGSLATSGYLYEMESVSDGIRQPIWQNLLAPHSSVVDLAVPPVTQEYSADEFFGTVAELDTPGNVWRSANDGNRWSGVSSPFPSGGRFPVIGGRGQAVNGSDSNLGYDQAGNLYLTTLADATPPSQVNSIIISRVPAATPLGSFSTPRVIPSTFGGSLIPPIRATADRPWLAVLRNRPNFVMLTWDWAGRFGRIAYCNAGLTGDCSAASAPWCPAAPAGTGNVPRGFFLPSDCIGGGCPIAQAGDGTVWVAISEDPVCQESRPTFDPPDIMRNSFGLRQITNLDDLDSNCRPPQLSEIPECIYYTTIVDDFAHISPSHPRFQLVHVGNTAPGPDARWVDPLVGAPDSGDILLGFRDYVDLNGNPCSAIADGPCRVEVRMLRRDATTGRWCGTTNGSCLRPPIFMSDPAYSANADPGGRQVDHTLIVLGFYSYGQASSYWMDFSSSPGTDLTYDHRRRLTRYWPGADVVGVSSVTAPWPSTLPVPTPYVAQARIYGDIEYMATARLHSHSLHLFAPGGAQQRVVTILSSPRTPPE